MSELSSDPELTAIQSIISVLEPLDVDARQRVIAYVFQRLRLSFNTSLSQINAPNELAQPQATPSLAAVTPITDIRTLKSQKAPRSSNEMCALVAYYLAELAPVEERKDYIDKDDALKYFKQAAFPLPQAPRQMLPNAAKSGFFDVLGGGKYRLNPVGYNLVVHGLPAKAQSS